MTASVDVDAQGQENSSEFEVLTRIHYLPTYRRSTYLPDAGQKVKSPKSKLNNVAVSWSYLRGCSQPLVNHVCECMGVLCVSQLSMEHILKVQKI